MDVCELSENQLIVGDDSSTNRDSNIHEYHEESQSMVLHIYSSPMVDELIWDVLVRSKNLISFKQYDDDNTGASMKKKTLLFVDDTEEKDNFQNTTVGDSLALQPKRDRQPNGSPPIGKPQIEPTKINKTKTKGEKSSPSSISTRSRPWEPFSEGETCTPDALLHKATKLKTSFLHNFPEFHPNHIVCYFLFLPVENHVRYRFGIGLPWQTWHQTSSTLLKTLPETSGIPCGVTELQFASSPFSQDYVVDPHVVNKTQVPYNIYDSNSKVVDDIHDGDAVWICAYRDRHGDWHRFFAATESKHEECAACGNESSTLMRCRCDTVSYCNNVCKKNHAKHHRKHCAPALYCSPHSNSKLTPCVSCALFSHTHEPLCYKQKR